MMSSRIWDVMSQVPGKAEVVETEPLTRSLSVSSPRMAVIDCSVSGSCCSLARFHAPDQVIRTRHYPSDVKDAEWAVVEAALPVPAWLAGNGGRPEKHCRRVMIDAI